MDQPNFEESLRKQPFREIPRDWKQQLLSKAQASSATPNRPMPVERGLRDYLRRLLWPCPEAWAGLAAVWLVLLIANTALAHSAPAARTPISSPSPVAGRSYKEQEKLLVELLQEGPGSAVKSAKPQASPSPQSSRGEALYGV